MIGPVFCQDKDIRIRMLYCTCDGLYKLGPEVALLGVVALK